MIISPHKTQTGTMMMPMTMMNIIMKKIGVMMS